MIHTPSAEAVLSLSISLTLFPQQVEKGILVFVTDDTKL